MRVGDEVSRTDVVRIDEGRDDLPFQIHWELDDAPLTVDAFRVYAHLVRCAGKNGLVFPSYQSIGEKCFRASVGATANPRSLRNRAMRAMKELVDCGLVLKQARTKKDRSENDSNIYTLTPRRQWLEEMKLRRQQLDSQIVKAKGSRASDSGQSEGGTPTMPPPGIPAMPPGTPTMPPPGTPAMPRGTVSMPEVISTEVLQSFEVNSMEETSSSVPVDAGTDWLPDDDDLPADAEPQNPNPTPEAPHRPDPVQPSSQAAETPPPTDPENVPGAAAGGAAPAWAILALPVIPRRELEGRALRDPASIPQLRALLHCSHKSRLPQLQVELEAATRSGIPRSLLTRLTDQELKAATSAAKTDAPKVEGGFARAGIHALHRLIGEPLTPALLKGEKEPARDVRGAAYDVKNEPSGKATRPAPEVETPRVSIEVGSRWEHKHIRDKIGTVVASEGGWVELHNGERVLSYEFGTNYRRVD